MQIDRVINGILKYMDQEIYPGLSDWQEILARMAVTRVTADRGKLKDAIKSNSFVTALNIVNESGEVDVNGIMADLKSQISAKGKIEIHIPLFGKFCFSNADVDKLHRMIMEG